MHAAFLYSVYKGRGRRFSRGVQTVRPEQRRGRGTVIWVISLSGFTMQSTHDPLNACPSINSEITLKCFSCSLLKSGRKMDSSPPPRVIKPSCAVVGTALQLVTGWDGANPRQLIIMCSGCAADLLPQLDDLYYRHQGRRSCDCQHLFLSVGKITCFQGWHCCCWALYQGVVLHNLHWFY